MTTYFKPDLITKVRTYIHKAIAEHRGSKRLWVQGRRLADAGFTKGAGISYSVNQNTGSVVIKLDPESKKIVSGRVNRSTGDVLPIIDILSQDFPSAGTRVRITVLNGLILVDLHHEEKKKLDRENRLREIAAGKRTLKEGSLCTGIGVSTYGVHESLKKADILSSLDWVVDIEGKYLDVAARNNPAVTDDTQLVVASLEELEPELLGHVDLLSVSLPCTGFSLSGRSKLHLAFGEAHPDAATAMFGFMQIVKRVNPSVICSENVKQAQDSATYHLIISELQRIGYRVMEIVLNGSDAGTLEDRERYYFVAVSEGVADSFSLEDLPKCEKIYQTMGDIREEIPANDPSWKAYEYLEKKAVSDALAGKGFKRQFIYPESTSVGTTGKGYFKARSTEGYWRRSDGLQRLMTIAEHAAVKLIPFKLVEGLAPTIAHEGLGQSVLLPHVTSIMDRITLGIRSLQPA